MQAAKLACNPLMNMLPRHKMRKHASESERMGQMRQNETGILVNFQQIQKEIDPEKHEMP